jgi:endonuclease/exonuclease/phosphatase (EEP) superfamily protein YafD
MKRFPHRPGSWWIAVVALVATAGMLGSLGHLAWWLELFSHFRPQYATLLLVCAVGLFARRRPGAGLAALALALANALPLMYYLAPAREPAVGGPGLSAVLINVWFRNDHYERVLDYISGVRPDLAVFLEVTPAWMEALRRLEPLLPYQAQAGEVFVASKHPLGRLRAVPLAGDSTTAVVFSVDAEGTPVTVIGAHANWPLGPAIAARRNRELIELATIARAAHGPTLLLGDFNVTAFSPAFAWLLADSGLRDCSAGRGLHPTWPARFPPLYIQIDHCLSGGGLEVARLSTGPYVGSDHYPLEIELRLVRPGGSGGEDLRVSHPGPASRR